MSTDDRAPRAANIFDVARLAGVSHQTVSRVLNDAPNVRPATRERVQRAIAQLRYSPSPAARALVTRRTRTVGLVTPGNVDFGPSSIALHFSRAARTARYSVETVSALESEPTEVRSAVEELLRQRVDAIVVIAASVSMLETVRGLDLGIPLVAVAAVARPDATTVAIDQYRGARAAVRHLAELGHTRIVHIQGDPEAPDSMERLRGWRDELTALRLPAAPPLVGDWTAASGASFADDPAIERGVAVFCGNDMLALGLISGLHARGLRVPDDVSIVGFDDVPEAGYLIPPLTTVRQDFAALGDLTMQKVLLAIEDPDSTTVSPPLAPRLVVRGSTAAPAG
ncbi:MAG: LacI family DNA-binding transcriptional regulator [Actinomycetales bacterium]|nr:LacI family DNA-binding transcriptional regulator [Actinomycetales bacterium]